MQPLKYVRRTSISFHSHFDPDNATAILRKIHEQLLVRVGSNSDADNAALNTESEALMDAFHKSKTAIQLKVKK